MKLKYIIPALFAAFAAVTSCDDEKDTYLDEVRVSTSYVSVPADGGTAEMTISATDAWAFANIFKIDTGNKDDEGNKIYNNEPVPTWLTISKASGEAGETVITFSADKIDGGRTCELQLVCAGRTQRINVIQGSLEPADVDCKTVLEGADSKTYRITGIVTSIANTTYGNWYIEDGSETGTDRVYIYGTLDAKGNEKNFASLGIEVGDKVTVEGPKTTYNGTVELVNVTVVKIVKSLVKVVDSAIEVPKQGGDFNVRVLCTGNGLNVDVDSDWITMKSMKAVDDTTVITFNVAPNTGDLRTGKATFSSTKGSNTSSVEAVFNQKPVAIFYETLLNGSLAPFTVNDINVADTKTQSVWSYAAGYGAKATAGQACDSESDLVSPEIDLRTETAAYLTFDHACKFVGTLAEELTLWVTKDNGTTWTQVTIPTYPGNTNWDFSNSGVINLSAYVGNKIKLAFKYKSIANYGTWEIKNVKIVDTAE